MLFHCRHWASEWKRERDVERTLEAIVYREFVRHIPMALQPQGRACCSAPLASLAPGSRKARRPIRDQTGLPIRVMPTQ